jgi:D-xylonolactonase
MDRGTIAQLKDGDFTVIVENVPGELDSRFNDVIADPLGRVYCGTMSTEERKGRLYRLDLDGSLHLLLEDIGCSNGMAFPADRKSFYHTDSFSRQISLYDYAEETGALSNRRVFAQLSESDGMPDGATLDSEGRVWSALWGGGAVVRLDNEGNIDRRVSIPVPKASSVAFGGANYDQMYITTAGGTIRETDGPLAGALLRTMHAAIGVPEFCSRILL